MEADYGLLRKVETKIDGANSHDVRGAIARYRNADWILKNVRNLPGSEIHFCEDVLKRYDRLLRQFVAGSITSKDLNASIKSDESGAEVVDRKFPRG